MANHLQSPDHRTEKCVESSRSSEVARRKLEEVVSGIESEEKGDSSGSVELNVNAKIMQVGLQNDVTFDAMATPCTNSDDRNGLGPILKEQSKPDGILRVARSRKGFPDAKDDHLIQLLICKNQDERQVADITDKYDIIVTVSNDEPNGDHAKLKTPDQYQCERIKTVTKNVVNKSSQIGIVGFHFRFYEPNTKVKINFALQTAEPKKRGRKKYVGQHKAGEVVSEISVSAETGPPLKKRGKGLLGKAKGKKARKIPPSPELAPASCSTQGVELYKRSSWVMKQLQSRRDNAKWEEFEQFAASLLLEFRDVDTQITIKLEQSVAACYRNELERSLELIAESFELMPQATNVYLLAGRGYGYRAGVKRRQGNLGAADADVQLALQSNRSCQTNLDTSFIVYEKASVLLDFIGRTTQRSPQQVNEALRDLERCIDVCLKVESQGSDFYVKKHHFALIKIAMLLLDCRTEAARDRVLSEEFIAKGQECLDTLKTKYWSEIPEGVKIQFFLASSDLEYRKGNYSEAERFANLAKNGAGELGFNTEISHAQERLDHVCVITRVDRARVGNFPATPAISGSEGDVSSSESDWLPYLE